MGKINQEMVESVINVMIKSFSLTDDALKNGTIRVSMFRYFIRISAYVGFYNKGKIDLLKKDIEALLPLDNKVRITPVSNTLGRGYIILLFSESTIDF